MVHVEVGIYYYIYIVEGQAMLGQGVLKGWTPLYAVDAMELFVPLIPYARIYQDVSFTRLNKETSEGHGDTIFFIGRAEFLPQDPGHHPEHGPAIKVEESIGTVMERETAQLHEHN